MAHPSTISPLVDPACYPTLTDPRLMATVRYLRDTRGESAARDWARSRGFVVRWTSTGRLLTRDLRA